MDAGSVTSLSSAAGELARSQLRVMSSSMLGAMVGQDDAIVIKSGSWAELIDAGPSGSTARDAVLWLTSDSARYVTGIALPIDARGRCSKSPPALPTGFAACPLVTA